MKKEIGKNVSSGAEKVEKVEREQEFTPESVNEQKEQKAPAARKKSPAKKAAQKTAVKKEHAAADRRVAAAKERNGKKDEKTSVKQARIEKRAAIRQRRIEKRQRLAEKRLERKELIAKKKAERLEKRQQRRADLKARRVEKRAERIARREMLKNESKLERSKRIAREKKERIALKAKRREAREREKERKLQAREAAHARKAEDRKHKREQKTERKKHAPGFGGWLAAVISLGTACLVLATVVTAGALRMDSMQTEAESGYRTTLYEMVEASEGLDDDLSKLRVSAGNAEQRALLTDILVNSALMESAIEKIPVDSQTSTDISSFVNKTGSYARTLLRKISAGGTLSSEERETVAHLYSLNDRLYQELNELVTHLERGDIRDFMTGKGGTVAEKFGELGESAKEKTLQDAPFAEEGNVGENRLARFEEITSSEAEERVRELFAAYHVQDVKYTGETLTQEVACYNFTVTCQDELEIFAEITKNGGKLAFFDTYEECKTKNFDLATCDAIAREYLASIGVGNVEAVWLSDGGMIANLTYTAVEDGVRIYPEIIRIRVCEEKGRVVGMDARGYLLNDEQRDLSPALSAKEAKAKLNGGLEPYAQNLALIPVEGQEVLCYEFACKYGEEEFIVYLDARTGEEVQIFRVLQSARGSYLR